MSNPIPPTQEEILLQSYEIWRQSPVTQLFIKTLLNFKQEFVNKITASALPDSSMDNAIKFHSVSLKNTDAILKIVTDFDTFKQQVTKLK